MTRVETLEGEKNLNGNEPEKGFLREGTLQHGISGTFYAREEHIFGSDSRAHENNAPTKVILGLGLPRILPYKSS